MLRVCFNYMLFLIFLFLDDTTTSSRLSPLFFATSDFFCRFFPWTFYCTIWFFLNFIPSPLPTLAFLYKGVPFLIPSLLLFSVFLLPRVFILNYLLGKFLSCPFLCATFTRHLLLSSNLICSQTVGTWFGFLELVIIFLKVLNFFLQYTRKVLISNTGITNVGTFTQAGSCFHILC